MNRLTDRGWSWFSIKTEFQPSDDVRKTMARVGLGQQTVMRYHKRLPVLNNVLQLRQIPRILGP